MEISKDTTAKAGAARLKNIAFGSPFVLIFSAVSFFLYIYLTNFTTLSSKETGFWGLINHNNTLKYFFGLILLAITFLILRFITGFVHHKFSDKLFFTNLPRAASFSLFLIYSVSLGVFLMYYVFHTELEGGVYGASPEILMWHRLPLALIIGYVGTLVIWTLYQLFRERDAHKSTAYLAYFIAILISYFSLLFINVDNTHHAIAYTESIYNVYSGAPYNIITTGIYGHYGIFFGALLRLVGGNAVTLAHLIALTGALSTAACAYTIHILTSKNYIRISAILASILSISTLRYSNYWQLQPHRVLFPLLTIAFVAHISKNKDFSKKKIILGYALCSLAIIWNTESGMFCVLAYTLALIVHFWQSNIWYKRKMWLRYAALVGAMLASLIAAVLFVNIYNLLVGGELILKDFFFPLMIDDYMNDALKINMMGGTQVWILVLLLFIILLFFGFYHTKFLRPEQESFDDLAPAFIALAVIALLNFSYFANRAAYFNLDICCQLACIAMALFADRAIDDWTAILRKNFSFAKVSAAALSLCCTVILVVMSTQIIFAVDPLSKKYDQEIWNTKIIEAQAEEFSALVPEDYMVIGAGASTLNLQLERKAEHCYRDFSDLTIDGTLVSDTIVEDAIAHGKVAFYLTEKDTGANDLMERILASENFVLTAEGDVGDATIKCYKKK